MANEKIKLLYDYEKQRLEDSHKHIGSKFICKLEKKKKKKNCTESYLKNLLD